MAVIHTECSCGQPVEIRTGADSRSSFRTDRKQAVYPGEEGYCIFRCRQCSRPLDETVEAYAFEPLTT